MPMVRFTNKYSPAAVVLVVRVNAVCSSTTVTVALGSTPPEESVTSPVMPPRVCCAGEVGQHSAMAAATASSRGIREKDERIEYLNLKASEVEISSPVC